MDRLLNELLQLRSEFDQLAQDFSQPPPPSERPRRKASRRQRPDPPSNSVPPVYLERLQQFGKRLNDALDLANLQASKTIAETAVAENDAPSVDSTRAVADNTSDASRDTPRSTDGIENSQAVEYDATLTSATAQETVDANEGVMEHDAISTTATDDTQPIGNTSDASLSRMEGIENEQAIEYVDALTTATDDTQGNTSDASLATPIEDTPTAQTPKNITRAKECDSTPSISATHAMESTQSPANPLDEGAEMAVSDTQEIESPQNSVPTTPESMDEDAETTASDTQALGSAQDSVPTTPDCMDEDAETTQATTMEAIETQAAMGSTPRVTKLTLGPEDIGAKFVHKIAELVENQDGFSHTLDCTSILDSPALKVELKAALRPSISNPDYTVNHYKPIDGESGCSTLDISTDSEFQWPNFTDNAPQPSYDEALAFIEKAISEPREDPISYLGGVPDHPGPGILHSGEQLSSLEDLTIANQEYHHIGEAYSATALHHEDAHFWSVNLVLAGYKGWIVAGPQEADKLKALVKRISPGEACDCDQFVRHQNILIAPSRLKAEGINFEFYIDGPGTARLIRECCYHLCVNLTNCASISTNLLLPDRALFPGNVKVCSDCGLYNLHQKYGFQVVVIRSRKRKRSYETSTTERQSSRLLEKQCFQLQVVLEKDPLCILPSRTKYTKPETYELAAAICSREALIQFIRLVDAWKLCQTPQTIPEFEAVPSSTDSVRSLLTRLIASQRDGELGLYRTRVHYLQLMSSRTRLPPDQVDIVCDSLGWNRSDYNNARDKAKRYLNICNPSTRDLPGKEGFYGLSPFIPLQAFEPIQSEMHGASPSRYVRLNKEAVMDMHNIIPFTQITTQLTAGRVLENAIATGTYDFKFVFEDAEPRPDWKTIPQEEVDALLHLVQDCQRKWLE